MNEAGFRIHKFKYHKDNEPSQTSLFGGLGRFFVILYLTILGFTNLSFVEVKERPGSVWLGVW